MPAKKTKAKKKKNIDSVLDQIADDTVADAKQQLQDWLQESKTAADEFIKECAGQLEAWLIDLASKRMTALEFNRLVAAQELLLANRALNQAARGQERAGKIAIKILQTTAEKVVPALLMAI